MTRVVTDTGPFTIVPEWLLASEVSDRAVRLYAVLGRHADTEGKSFPSRRTLAKQLRCSVSSLDRAVEELGELGAVDISERFTRNGDQTSNLYRLLRRPPSSRVNRPLFTDEHQNENYITRRVSPKGLTPMRDDGKRPRNEVWDALVYVFGEPETETRRRLRGKVCRSLAGAGATYDEIVKRAKVWPRHFDDATLTETALEKHWDALGRKPLRAGR